MRGAVRVDSAGRARVDAAARVDLEQDAARMDRADPARTIL
jgi:hypothetical protein